MPITGYPSWVPLEKNKLSGGSWITLLELTYGNSYTEVISLDNPAGYWRLNETSGTAAEDFTINNKDGTYVSGPTLGVAGLLTGDADKAISLVGTNDYVVVPDSMVASTPRSIEVWFKGSGSGVLFGHQNAVHPASPTSYAPALYVDNAGFLRGAIFSGVINTIVSGTQVNDNVRHHAVLVINATSFSLYLDGVLVGTTVASVSELLTKNQFGTGYTSAWPNTPGGWYFYNGIIDEAAIYNSSLTLSQVQNHYNAGTTGASQKLRLAKWSENVTWNSQVWTAWPIGDITPSQNIEGELPTTTIPVVGITSFIMSVLENFVIEGKKGNIYIVHADHLADNTPVKQMPFTVISVSCTWEMVNFLVVMAQAAFEPLKAQLPLKLVTREEFPGVMGSRITV